MANIIIRPEWYIPENRVTPEKSYFNRRSFLKQMGFAGSGALTMKSLDGFGATKARRKLFPAKRNGNFSPPWRLTDETWATHYNNFYEFSTQKTAVVGLVGDFKIDPWQIKIHGLCDKPLTIDARDLAEKIGLEERVYRFRCVEAWSMVVPWTGFPLNKVLRMVKPKAEAKFVKFITAMKPAEMPGINYLRGYPWPYTEGLRLDEAMNDLALVTTGMYGKPLPKQNGAPIRMIVPWKYGYKSIKSIVEIELVSKQPSTLWETLSAEEYPFESNVEPRVPHPRWSQATERVVDTDDRIRTLEYNGYGEQVARLYKK